jgi:hypothetical protein
MALGRFPAEGVPLHATAISSTTPLAAAMRRDPRRSLQQPGVRPMIFRSLPGQPNLFIPVPGGHRGKDCLARRVVERDQLLLNKHRKTAPQGSA